MVENAVLAISWCLCAVLYLYVTIYGFRLLKMDWELGKRTEKRSVQKLAIIAGIVGCILRMGSSIIYSVHWWVDYEIAPIYWIFYLASEGISAGMFFFSLLVITMQSVHAMVLSESGIAASRERWLILLRRYLPLTAFLIMSFSVMSPGKWSMWCNAGLLFLFGALSRYVSYRFKKSATSTDLKRRHIRRRCTEVEYLAMILSIFFFLLSLFEVSNLVLTSLEFHTVVEYQHIVSTLMTATILYVIIRDLSIITIRTHDGIRTKENQRTSLIQETPCLSSPTSATVDTGSIITDVDQVSLDMVPLAPRPTWLPNVGIGQANVGVNRWSISLENWDKFIHECMATTTWAFLTETKGEEHVTMYDINEHFVKPWTRGTGCSIACLIDNDQKPVELMVSHAWAGSVIESLAAMKTITNMYLLPKETPIFFDTFCMYQAEDGATGGLTISEQLLMKPFSTVINESPRHGMFVIHTTISEVYDRLWCVHEADEAIEAGVKIFGAFDPERWTTKAVRSIVTNFSTRYAKCQGENDKEMLTELINERGGFDRLDEMVVNVRRQSIQDLREINRFEQIFSTSFSSSVVFEEEGEA